MARWLRRINAIRLKKQVELCETAHIFKMDNKSKWKTIGTCTKCGQRKLFTNLSGYEEDYKLAVEFIKKVNKAASERTEKQLTERCPVRF